jgi:hypothetical protein
LKFALAQYISPEVSDKSGSINSFSNRLSEYFAGRDYGPGIQELYIGIVCVSPAFEKFFKPRRPSYQRGRCVYEKEGTKYELDHTAQIDILLDFKAFQRLSLPRVESFIGKCILEGISQVNTLGVPDFDMTAFTRDLDAELKITPV